MWSNSFLTECCVVCATEKFISHRTPCGDVLFVVLQCKIHLFISASYVSMWNIVFWIPQQCQKKVLSPQQPSDMFAAVTLITRVSFLWTQQTGGSLSVWCYFLTSRGSSCSAQKQYWQFYDAHTLLVVLVLHSVLECRVRTMCDSLTWKICCGCLTVTCFHITPLTRLVCFLFFLPDSCQKVSASSSPPLLSASHSDPPSVLTAQIFSPVRRKRRTQTSVIKWTLKQQKVKQLENKPLNMLLVS